MSYRDYHKKRIEHLNKIVNSLPGETICDLGSWEGCLNTKRKVYRVDINKEFKPDVVADARNIPFKSEIFELVVCSHLIEHVKNPLNIVKEAKRILKSGGLLLLETPNISSLKNKIKLMLGKNITSWKWNSPKLMGHLHYREYTMSELRELIACVGLIEKSNYGNISYRCGRKGMILERISSVFPKSWKHSIGIIGIKPLKKGAGDADMNCPNGRFLRNKFVYEKWIKPLDIDNILDVGCSNNYMKILHKNTTGIDIQGNPDIKFNLEKGPIPLKENSFDCVVCLDVLEHLDNLHEVLDQLIKISKRFVILSFPNEIRWLYLLRYTYKTNDREFGLNPRNRHKWFLSYTQSRDFFHNYAKQKNMIIYDEFISLGNISKILHRLLNFKFPNLMPYTYFVVLKKD